MKQTGINLESVKVRNKASILQLLRREGGMSRKDIAGKIGLTPAAVTLLCNEMIEAGMIRETGEVQEERRAGRRKIMVDIDYNWRYVLGVTIERRNTCISLCNLKAELLLEHTIRTDDTITPEAFLQEIAQECIRVLFEGGKSKADLVGVGVSVPGNVDRNHGLATSFYGIWKHEVDIAGILSQELDCPVVVENNVRAFAQGEAIYNQQEAGTNILFLKWGPGVGSALIANGSVYDGRDHRGVEIGHYILQGNPKHCSCGRVGCLETLVSTKALAEQIRQASTREDMPKLNERLTGSAKTLTEEQLVDFLEQDSDPENADSAVMDIMQNAVNNLARAFVNVGTILAPDLCVVFGSVLSNDLIRTKFIEACHEYDPYYTADTIQLAGGNQQTLYLGAASIAAFQFFYGSTAEVLYANHEV